MEQEAVSSDQLPPDVTGLYMKIEGPNAFVEVKNRCRFKNLQKLVIAILTASLYKPPTPWPLQL